jgi:SsrA-binding protein
MKILFTNKKLNLNYHIIDTYESGISLKGTEVKSISAANASIDEAFVIFKGHQAYVINMYIAPFIFGNIHNVDSYRTRKLLLHKHEIIKLEYQSKKERLAIVPNKIYFKNNKIKIEIATCKSKNVHDKRQDKKDRDDLRIIKNYK